MESFSLCQGPIKALRNSIWANIGDTVQVWLKAGHWDRVVTLEASGALLGESRNIGQLDFANSFSGVANMEDNGITVCTNQFGDPSHPGIKTSVCNLVTAG